MENDVDNGEWKVKIFVQLSISLSILHSPDWYEPGAMWSLAEQRRKTEPIINPTQTAL